MSFINQLILFLKLISLIALIVLLFFLAPSSGDPTTINDNTNDKQLSCLNTDSQKDCLLYESIIKQERALVEECGKYINHESAKLETVLSHNIIHFEPDPPPIRIPAICWLVESFKRIGGQHKNGSVDTLNQNPMELVSWVLDNNKPPNQKQHDNVNENEGINAKGQKTVKIIDKQSNQEGQHKSKQPIITNQVGSNQEINKLLNDLISDNKQQALLPIYKGELGKFHPSHLSPFILIPGLMGSRLEDKLNKSTTAHWWCRKTSDWQEGFWLSLENFLPFVLDCWLDNMRLEYDPVTGFAKSPPGVEVRSGPFGKIGSVVSLDASFTSLSEYMQPIVDKLLTMGYESDVNLLAAPYDFRLVPQQFEQPGGFFDELTQLIESAQDGVGYGNPVTLLCHSMGCTNALVFLRSKSPEWRANRILKLIALSAPWGGAFVATKQLVSGAGYSIPLVSTEKLRQLTRTMPSMAFLQPQAEVFGSISLSNDARLLTGSSKSVLSSEQNAEPFVKTPQRTYGIGDIGQLMRDIKLPHQAEWYNKTIGLIKPFEPLLDVKTVCIHGRDIATPRAIVYKQQDQFPDGDYETEHDNGDGTVNLESLSVCKQWAEQNPDMIQNIELFNIGHKAILEQNSVSVILQREVLAFVNSKS